MLSHHFAGNGCYSTFASLTVLGSQSRLLTSSLRSSSGHCIPFASRPWLVVTRTTCSDTPCRKTTFSSLYRSPAGIFPPERRQGMCIRTCAIKSLCVCAYARNGTHSQKSSICSGVFHSDLAHTSTRMQIHALCVRIWHSAIFGANPMALCAFTMERSWIFPIFGTSIYRKRK